MKENEQEEVKTEINELNQDEENPSFPLLSVKRTVFFSASTVNHFALSIGLFLYMYMKFNWLNALEDPLTEQFFYYYLIFTGIIQYIIGFYDWYRGRTISFTLDFVFGIFYVMTYFQKYPEGITDVGGSTHDKNRQGTFYAILAGFLLVLALGCKRKGFVYLVDIFALFLGFVFLFIYYFWTVNWCNTAAKYVFVVVSCLFWLTGLGNLINDVCQKKIIPLLDPAI